MKKNILILAAYCLMVLNAQAQFNTKEQQPYGLAGNTQLQSQQPIVLAAPNRILIDQEDQENDQQSHSKRFAYPVLVNYTPENSGLWQQMDDGTKIWRLKVNISGALSPYLLR